MPARVRAQVKAFDVFVQRFARGIAALLLLTVTFGLVSPLGAGWYALGFVLAWLWVAQKTDRHYVELFRQTLGAGLEHSALARKRSPFECRREPTCSTDSLGDSWSEDRRTFAMAAALEGLHGDGDASKPRITAARDRDPDPRVRETAAWVLDRMDAPAKYTRDGGEGETMAPSRNGRNRDETEPLAHIEVVLFLRDLELFRYCDTEETLRVAHIARERRLQRNDPSDALYCVVEGRIHLDYGSERLLTVGPGETFGVGTILSGRLRDATATAVKTGMQTDVYRGQPPALEIRNHVFSAVYRTSRRELYDFTPSSTTEANPPLPETEP